MTSDQRAQVLAAGWGAAVLDRLRAWRQEQEVAGSTTSQKKEKATVA